MICDAELIVPGPVILIGAGVTAPAQGAAIDDHDGLWIDGRRYGRVHRTTVYGLKALPWHIERVYTHSDQPADTIVHTSKICCQLDLPGTTEP